MTKFIRNSRMRRVISSICAVAMLSSLMIMPAFAAEDGNVTAFTPGSNMVAAQGTYNRGVQGTLVASTVCTPAAQARQDGIRTFPTPESKAAIMGPSVGPGSLGVTQTAGDYALNVAVYRGGVVATSVAITGISLDTSVSAAVDRIDAVLGALPSEWAADAFFTVGGTIRIVKRRAEAGSEIWAFSGPTADPSSDPAGLSLAEALFAGAETGWGRGSGPAGTYVAGSDNQTAAITATWTPTAGNAIALPGGAFQYGSFVDGDMTAKVFQSTPDTQTGLYTAIKAGSASDLNYVSWTADRNQPVVTGTSSAVFGNGVRYPGWEQNCETDGYDVYTTGSVVATAGAVTTWTVEVDDPDSTDGSQLGGAENAYNGISVLFPAEFDLVNGPNHADFLTGLVTSVNSTPTVETTKTPAGWLVTITNFVDDPDPDDGISFQVALKSPTDADLSSVGAKMWIHNVGTAVTANPIVTQLVDPRYTDSIDLGTDDVDDNSGDGVRDTDWVPVFCQCGPIYMDVEPDVIKTVTLKADPNRAKGSTALMASAVDQYGNEVTGFAEFSNPTITGATDGASTAIYPAAAAPVATGDWIWRLANTPGVNTASITVNDNRTVAVEAIPASASFNNTGFGEPAKVVILPSATTYFTGGSPAVQIQLQDANGNPTSWLDDHVAGGPTQDWFEIVASSQNNPFPQGQSNASRYIWKGWSKASPFSGGAAENAWPNSFGFGMTVQGPDTWTFSAKHRSGSVMPAAFTTVDILDVNPDLSGIPHHLKVTAVATAPAEFAVGDGIYNDKTDDYDDDAFGWAAAGGTEVVTLQAQVVDVYNKPITQNVANIAVTWGIEKFDYVNAILPTGHTYETTTNAQGIATAVVKSFSPTISTRNVPSWGESSWFTPVRAELTYASAGTDWANPCGSTKGMTGYGFTYFHGAELVADLEQTIEGEDKEIALADGVDSVMYTATVWDSAFFETPIPNWDVKFTTSLGTFANGTKAATMTTDANGKAMVTVKSPTAGSAYLRVYDRLGRTDSSPFQQNSVTRMVSFTDYKVVSEALEATKRAGDRATAAVRVWFENIKTGQKVQWYGGSASFDTPDVYGYCADCHAGVAGATMTNQAMGGTSVDTNADGKWDALEYTIPAIDDEGQHVGYMESAGKRYALAQGQFTGQTYVNQVFYNATSFVAAPARPEVNFVKEAVLSAEGNQFHDALGFVGSKFTPGTTGPEDTDIVTVALGDIRTGDYKVIGEAYVGRDGQLLPIGIWYYQFQNQLRRMSPGMYTITVDGLVFTNGLEIKNLFRSAWISIDGSKADVVYIDGSKSHVVQVNAFGSDYADVWAGSLKLKSGDAVGRFTLPANSMDPGSHFMTAKIWWNDSYSSQVSRQYYITKSLKFSSTKLSASGNVLKLSGKVSGPAEANGSAPKVKVQFQRLSGGSWKNYGAVKTVASVNGKYSYSYNPASGGTFRVKVSHSDKAHPSSGATSNTKAVK